MNYFLNLLKNIDKVALAVVGILAVISVLMIGSTQISSGFWSRDVIVQIGAYVIGLILLTFILYINYSIFNGTGKYLYILAIALLLLVYVPGLGLEQYGSRAWINLRFMTVQPSEIVKVLFVLIMAEYLNKHHEDLYNFKGLMKSAIVAAPIIVIVLKEDFGSALVFAVIWLAMIFFAGVSMKVFAKFIVLVIACVPPMYLLMADYQKERISAFLHPSNLSLGSNYQVWESKIAIGSGGVFGQGLFKGSQKALDFIPVQKSDFIFSVIAEELGLVGAAVVIGLFTILLVRFMRAAINAYDLYGALIVVGFIGMFIFQIFENIAMTMGLMPVTGITLPFLSYGGTSILSNMMALGFILSVSVRSKGINF